MISVRESTKTASSSGIDRHPSSGSGGSGGGNDWHPERNGGSNSDYDSPVDKYKVAVWVVLAGVSMMFTALTSAYVVRALTDVGNNGWVPISVPGMLWVSSTLIVASSITLTLAGRELVRGRDRRFSRFLWLTALLGAGFLISQLLSWRELAAQGLYLSSNPHSSFFYVLTALHGLHLLVGLFFLSYLVAKSFRPAPVETTESLGRKVSAFSIYWHFMDGLWIYLFCLLFVWK